MVAYHYDFRIALVKGSPNVVAANATVLVYDPLDTSHTTPVSVYSDPALATIVDLITDQYGIVPDFWSERPDVLWKSGALSGGWATTTSRPGIRGLTGAQGATGPIGPNGTPGLNGINADVTNWITGAIYAVGDSLLNPSGDLVRVTTAHTSGGSYDATKFSTPYDTATTTLVVTPASSTRGALNNAYGTFVSPMANGATGDGVANDYAALAATMTAATTGTVIDLGGRTFNLGQTWSISKAVTIRNGTFTSAVDRVAIVSAANVRLENVKFIRTGPATASSGALTLNAAGCVLIDVTATSTYGEGLRMGNGTCNGTLIRGGSYASSDPNDSFAIQLLSGATHNYDVKVSGATIRNTGYGTGIGLYNCSRSTVENCDVRSIRRSPWFTATGWTLVSGTVYKALDRTDVTSNAVYVNGVEYGKNSDPASTTPASSKYTTPGDGYLYINTGIDPTSQTVTTTRTNGYGILFYATSGEALGMRDNLMAHNYVEDTDGFGLYYQTLMNVPRNNRTLQNTLRNVCLTGVTVGDLPFAGIGVFGGLDVQLEGDMIDGVGSVGSPAPGIDFKASVGVPSVAGTLTGVTVRNATAHGISLCVGTWLLSNVSAHYNTGSGIAHGTIVNSTDILDVTLSGCFATYNTLNGAHFETSTGDIEVQILGGRYTNNTIRNLNIVRCRNVFIGGGVLSGWAGNTGISVTGTNQRVILDGIFLRSGVGLNVGSGIADLTINNVVNDGSSGSKFTVTGPYKVGGSTGVGTQWRCTGTPEGAITAAIGSTATRIDGGAVTTLYVKESGTGNTGWVAK